MKKVYFTPGPSQLYPTVEQHLAAALTDQVGSISHRSQAFMDIYAHTVEQLRLLLKVPEDYQILFLSSANEAWERIAQNCIAESSFHMINGNFSQRFASMVQQLGKRVFGRQVPFGEGFEMDQVTIPDDAELIAAIANETSSGVWTPPRSIEALRQKHPGKLIVVDGVSALPFYNLDLEQVDSIYFSVQKGFGLPAGLGVLVLSPRMLAKAAVLQAEGWVTGSYHSFDQMLAKAEKSQTVETPNVLGIYLLGRVVEDMRQREEELRAEIADRASRWYGFFEAQPQLEVFVKNPEHRSPYVIVVDTPEGESSKWVRGLSEKGYVIGAGYGAHKPNQLRIANFPATSREDMEGLMKAFQELT